jgi:hypothetical protein
MGSDIFHPSFHTFRSFHIGIKRLYYTVSINTLTYIVLDFPIKHKPSFPQDTKKLQAQKQATDLEHSRSTADGHKVLIGKVAAVFAVSTELPSSPFIRSIPSVPSKKTLM